MAKPSAIVVTPRHTSLGGNVSQLCNDSLVRRVALNEQPYLSLVEIIELPPRVHLRRAL